MNPKYNDYIIKDSKLKRFYFYYINNTIYEKVLDIVLSCIVLIILSLYIAKYIFSVDISGFERYSLLVFVFFILELVREYVKSIDFEDFVWRNWFDISLAIMLSLYFFIGTYLGYNKFFKNVKIVKNLKILFNFKK